ncbi:MAG: hypothetical protein JSW51_01455 [Gemmatimonadota bacterium]|nr:MAG: hypothetical protein JSW51_01455 [Gemmatimonadota bacterium]
MRKPYRCWIVLPLLAAALSANGAAQGIGDEEYLHYVPLPYPRLSREAAASARFHLFGDRSSPYYSDVEPVDGIDDARGETLQAIALRFAPFMVQNTFSVPMDFKKLMMRQPTFNLYIDTWDRAHGNRLVGRETLDFNSLGQARCPGDAGSVVPYNPVSADCRVLELMDEFDPEVPAGAIERAGAVDLGSDRLKVLFFDMPGYDPQSWKAVYANPITEQLRTEFHDALKIYAHPFINEVLDANGLVAGYQFVIQYWFYYPLNDGGNNHEGDWEHIDVLIAPRSRVKELLTEEDVRAILSGEGMTDEASDLQLVIQRVEYYFHHKVMTLNYARPNVYQPREAWEQEWRALVREQFGTEKLWTTIRHYAYRDSSESLLNMHPIAFIGADNKGLDQLISPPGGRNQDSHGTFPFPGLYKTVGPAGSAEQIAKTFDHWEWYADLPQSRADAMTDFGRGHVVLFDRPELLEVVPDWERVLPLIRSDPIARRDWTWLVLPVRWGYPATESPLAGLIAHADMGNVGPIGPAYNNGWNRTGTGRGFEQYEPHVLPSVFPVDAQDGFSNNLGYFNVIPALTNLPPLDLVWRLVALPFRALLKRQDPIFFPEESVPLRFVGVVGGASYTQVPEDMWLAAVHLTETNGIDLGDGNALPETIVEIALDIITRDSLEGGDIPTESFSEAAWGWHSQVAFYVGKRFVSTTGVRNSRHRVGFFQPLTTGGVYEFSARLNWWDITGNVRYDVFTGGFKPYFKFGYGVNWYRLEDMRSDGEPLTTPTGEWINNFWPPTWSYGAGAELMLVQSFSPIPRGIDVGLQAEWLWLNGSTGLNLPGILTINTFREVPGRWVRSTLNLSVTVSF